MERGLAVLVVCLLFVAGCLGGTPADASRATASPPATATMVEPTPEAPPAARATTEPPPNNPWGKEPIVVGVRHEDEGSRTYTPLVEDAIRYWETDGSRYASWEPAFSFEPNASDPDVVVSFRSEIDRCELGHPGRAVGCASVLGPRTTPDDPEVIDIATGRTRYVTRDTIKHEFGHVLGLRHGDEPVDVMDEPAEPLRRGSTADYRVHLEHPTGYVGDERSREQVHRALEYYEGGAEGWLRGNVTFRTTADGDAADVSIVVEKGSPAGSYADLRSKTIYLEGIPTSRHGWHVGYWLGYLFGATDADGLPPAFDRPTVDDREEWW